MIKSQILKRSIVVAGHKTSVSLEDPFWLALREIAGTCDMTLSDLVAAIDTKRQYGNLSSAVASLYWTSTAMELSDQIRR